MMQPDELSKLPDDPAYWARLQSRVEGAVLGDLVSAPVSPPSPQAASAWYTPLARRAWWLSGLAAAAAIAVALVPRESAPPAPLTMLMSATAGNSLSPLMTREAPPAVAELLVSAAQSRAP
jgi:hypothetical protein